MPPDPLPSAVVLDLDGTLVDSLYLHVVSWHEALHAAGRTVPMARIHAGIGMGSDRLLPWLLGAHVDDARDIVADHDRRFIDRIDLLAETPGANALLDDLQERGTPYAIATSAREAEREALLAVLDHTGLPVVGGDQVGSSKPAPDLLVAACRHLEVAPGNVTMVGDAPWDALAAHRIGMEAVAVRCGGFGDEVLRGAGATRLVDAPRDLVGVL